MRPPQNAGEDRPHVGAADSPSPGFNEAPAERGGRHAQGIVRVDGRELLQ